MFINALLQPFAVLWCTAHTHLYICIFDGCVNKVEKSKSAEQNVKWKIFRFFCLGGWWMNHNKTTGKNLMEYFDWFDDSIAFILLFLVLFSVWFRFHYGKSIYRYRLVGMKNRKAEREKTHSRNEQNELNSLAVENWSCSKSFIRISICQMPWS